MLFGFRLAEKTLKALDELSAKRTRAVRAEHHHKNRTVVVNIIQELRKQLICREFLKLQYDKSDLNEHFLLYLVIKVINVEIVLIKRNAVHIRLICDLLYRYPVQFLFRQDLRKGFTKRLFRLKRPAVGGLLAQFTHQPSS